MKVIRLSDGLVMDFKMLLKSGNVAVQKYYGPTPVGSVDQKWLDEQRKTLRVNSTQRVDLVS